MCKTCGTDYSVVDGIVDLRLPTAEGRKKMDQWSEHWSSENQGRLAQRFFSFYRKAVFARSVCHFIKHYFPTQGVFVEAGSGTSESSGMIPKLHGQRILVAVDIVMPVLKASHPVMDVRICGDIFSLPFPDSAIDGLWNVGVMEHFTLSQIDQLMAEFHRVLKPGAPIFLLWPGHHSIPQKVLRGLEALINLRGRPEKYRFHPDEISKLRSVHEARAVLRKNGFRVLHVDWGLRSLMAFVTPVGAKI
jgi:SAM-dependent methyltransferase